MMMAVMVAAFLSVISFSSCLNDNGVDYDFLDYMTVVEKNNKVCLVGDMTGLTLYPANSSVLTSLRMNDGSYYKRVYAGVKLMEQYSQTKKEYTISDLYVSYAIPYMDFNLRKDTLKGDYGFNGLNKAWARTGYVNVEFNVNVESGNTSTFYNDLHMYVTRASQDTLYTKLRYAKPVDYGQNYTVLVSFELPEYSPEYYSLQPKDDKIVIAVEAEGRHNGTLQLTAPYNYSDLFN